MKLKFLVSALFLLAFLPAITEAVTSDALSAQIENVRREREALVEEQRKLQAELDKVSREGQNLGTAVKSLDATKKKLTSDIKVTQSKIRSTDLNIQILQNNVNTAEHQITTHQKAIGSVIQALSEYDGRSLVLELVASANFSDLWRDRSQLKGFSEDLNREVEELLETKSVLTKEKEKKEKVKAEALSLAKELSGQKVAVEESQKAKERLLVETKSKEAEYQRLIQENMARQKESEDDLYRLEQELRITLDPSLFAAPKRGVLSWPLDKIYITGRFGKTTDCKIYAGADCFHNGTDFRASMRTPVKAMLSGVVEGSGNTDDQKGCYSYGRWILIKHSNGLSSLYAHLSGSLVSAGQRVETGALIGYSGGIPGYNGSGYSKGAHLHVGLFASQGVQVRQFSTSKGCKLVKVPIASGREAYLDPLAYLPSL